MAQNVRRAPSSRAISQRLLCRHYTVPLVMMHISIQQGTGTCGAHNYRPVTYLYSWVESQSGSQAVRQSDSQTVNLSVVQSVPSCCLSDSSIHPIIAVKCMFQTVIFVGRVKFKLFFASANMLLGGNLFCPNVVLKKVVTVAYEASMP